MKNLPLMAAVAAGIAAMTMTAAPALADGAKAFKKNRCAQCHTVSGKHTIGPSLKGIMGQQAGTAEGYKKRRYSESLIAAGEKGLVWNDETIDAYITNPKQFLRDYLDAPKARSKMAYPGLKKEDERKLIVEYLNTLK